MSSEVERNLEVILKEEEAKAAEEKDSMLAGLSTTNPSSLELANVLLREPPLKYAKVRRLRLWKYLLEMKKGEVETQRKLLEHLEGERDFDPLDPKDALKGELLESLKLFQKDLLRKLGFFEAEIFAKFDPKDVPKLLPLEHKSPREEFYHDACLLVFALSALRFKNNNYVQSLHRLFLVLFYVYACAERKFCLEGLLELGYLFGAFCERLQWPKATPVAMAQLAEARSELASVLDISMIEGLLKSVSLDVFVFNIQSALFTDCFERICDAARFFDLLLLLSPIGKTKNLEQSAIVAYFHLKLPYIRDVETLQDFSDAFSKKLADADEFLRLTLVFFKQALNVKTIPQLFGLP